MLFTRRSDPTDAYDPDEMAMMGRFPKPLMWGLARGVLMLGAVAVFTWFAASTLQERAREEGQTAMARDSGPTPAPTSATTQAATPRPAR